MIDEYWHLLVEKNQLSVVKEAIRRFHNLFFHRLDLHLHTCTNLVLFRFKLSVSNYYNNSLQKNPILELLVCRASGASREKKSNFGGFSWTNSRGKRLISREFSRPVSLKNASKFHWKTIGFG